MENVENSTPEAVTEETKVDLVEVFENESLSPQEKIAAYLADPKNQEDALTEAEYLSEFTHGNWFSLERMQNKFKQLSADIILAKLENLYLFDYCLMRNDRGFNEFKIVLKPEDKIRYYELLIKKLDTKKLDLENEISRLREKTQSK